MHRLILFLVFASLPQLAPAQLAYPIDTKTSVLKWTGHAEVGTYAPSGTLSLREGRILIRDGNFAGANLLVDMNSMTQSNTDLLHHLKSADFFDVEHYPTCTIKIDRIDSKTVFGTITIRAKTTPFQAPVAVTQSNDRFLITGEITLDRTQYGIVYNSPSFFSGLGNQAIRNTFEVEYSLAGSGTIPEKYRH
jgi:polyisoprenoid-binding protein YceI